MWPKCQYNSRIAIFLCKWRSLFSGFAQFILLPYLECFLHWHWIIIIILRNVLQICHVVSLVIINWYVLQLYCLLCSWRGNIAVWYTTPYYVDKSHHYNMPTMYQITSYTLSNNMLRYSNTKLDNLLNYRCTQYNWHNVTNIGKTLLKIDARQLVMGREGIFCVQLIRKILYVSSRQINCY